MVVLGSVSHAETQWDYIEETRLGGFNALVPEIVTDVKDQLKLACRKGLSLKNGSVAAAIIIGGHFFQQRA